MTRNITKIAPVYYTACYQ